MMKLHFERRDLLLAIVRGLIRSDEIAHYHCNHPRRLGRCSKSLAYLLRELLAEFGITIRLRLFPRGKGNNGFRKSCLRDVPECAIYVAEGSANEAIGKITRKLML